MLGGPLLVIALLIAGQAPGWPMADRMLAVLPSLVFAGAALLGALRGRSHAVLVALFLLILHWELRLLGDLEPALGDDVLRPALTAIAVLVPLNFIYLGLAREHGLRSSETLHRFAFQLAQPLLLAWLVLPLPHAWLGLLGEGWIGAAAPGALDHQPLGPLTQPIWGAFLGAGLALAAMALHGRSEQAAGFFWALLAVLCALHLSPPSAAADLLLCAAGGSVLLGAQAHHARRLDWHELTELGTRRALVREMAAQHDLHCLAVVDIDHFKPLQDRWGEAVGEQIVRSVAFKLRNVRRDGRAYHLEGDRFALHFPQSTQDEVRPHVEEMRYLICETPFFIRRMKRRTESISVTIGLCESDDRWSSPSQMLEAAESAMYEGKGRGRNRTVMAGEPASHPIPDDGDPWI